MLRPHKWQLLKAVLNLEWKISQISKIKNHLGSVDKGYPQFCCDDLNEADEGDCGLIETGCDTSPVFELVEETFDQVAFAVGLVVMRDLDATVGFGWNDGFDAMKQQFLSDGVSVIAFICDHRLDLVFDEPEEGLERLTIVDFAAGEDKPDRPTLPVAPRVDFCGEAAARAPQSLRVLIPPFTPAAF